MIVVVGFMFVDLLLKVGGDGNGGDVEVGRVSGDVEQLLVEVMSW